MFGYSTAGCPQFDEVLGLPIEGVQHNPPELGGSQGSRTRCGELECHWILTAQDGMVRKPRCRWRKVDSEVDCWCVNIVLVRLSII